MRRRPNRYLPTVERLEFRRLLAADGLPVQIDSEGFSFEIESFNADGVATQDFVEGESIDLKFSLEPPQDADFVIDGAMLVFDGDRLDFFDLESLTDGPVRHVLGQREDSFFLFFDRGFSQIDQLTIPAFAAKDGQFSINARLVVSPSSTADALEVFPADTSDRVQLISPALALTVSDSASRPTGQPDSYETLEHLPLAVPAETGLMANDDSPGGSVRVVDAPEFGQLTLDATGAFTYTPQPFHRGSDHFTYSILEDGIYSEPIQVSMDVGIDPDLDVVLDVELIAEDASGAPLEEVVAGDPFFVGLHVSSNVEGVLFSGVKFRATGDPAAQGGGIRLDGQPSSDSDVFLEYGQRTADGVEGTVLAGWTLTAIPEPVELGFIGGARYYADLVGPATMGLENVEIEVAVDGQKVKLGESRLNISELVLNVTDGFSVVRDEYILSDQPESVLLPVLSNDRGDSLEITSVTADAGTFEIGADGKVIVYHVPDELPLSDSLTYTVRDASGESKTNSVLIVFDPERTIGASDILQGPNGDQATVEVASQIVEQRIEVLLNDPDPEKLVLVGAVVTHGSGSVRIAEDGGAILYTPGPDSHGIERLQYTVSRGLGGVVLGAASVDVSIDSMPVDTNGDQMLTPTDALLVINELNRQSDLEQAAAGGEGEAAPTSSRLDVNGDKLISPLDALLVINQLNRQNDQNSSGGSDSEAADVAIASWVLEEEKKRRSSL